MSLYSYGQKQIVGQLDHDPQVRVCFKWILVPLIYLEHMWKVKIACNNLFSMIPNPKRPEDYRPISLLNTLSKLCKWVVQLRLNWTIEENFK